ncbi:MAG: ABC transporter permease [Proteobacteria bacterium]|jgi:iron complex transport system permease protein|nr:MAG: ABC transporter permease [Pseudomonadota bacterium]
MRASAYAILLAALSGLVVLTFVGSLLIGPSDLGMAGSLEGLFSTETSLAQLVMYEIRLPRAVLGLMIGVTLGLSGAVLQGFLRNPLAEPGILGISSAAALGAVLAIYTGLSAFFPLALPLAGLAGAFVAVLLIRALTGANGSTLTLILAGVAVSAFAGAASTLVLNLSPNPFAATEILFWMLGSLTDRSMTHVWLAGPFMIIGWIMLASLARPLDTLTLGSDAAATMGINVGKLQSFAVFGTAASVGAAVSVAGAIGFVGLVVPHVLRPLVGSVPSRLLPASALGGAIVLLTADILVRLIDPGHDLKIGVLTAMVGAPFFLWLVYRSRRNEL